MPYGEIHFFYLSDNNYLLNEDCFFSLNFQANFNHKFPSNYLLQMHEILKHSLYMMGFVNGPISHQWQFYFLSKFLSMVSQQL